MRHIAPYRTPRIGVDLKELTLGAAIVLTARPFTTYEANQGACLAAIVERHEDRDGQVTDLRLWTVQERHAVISHYLAHTFDSFDFPVGENARFSNYLLMERPMAEPVALGPIADDEWTLLPLLGLYAESIERLMAQQRIPGKRHGWVIACMAAQMRSTEARESEFLAKCNLPNAPHQDLPEALVDDWLERRVQMLLNTAESDFADLMGAYLAGFEQQQHLVRMAHHDDGLVLVGEAPGLPPARFPVSDLFGRQTQRLLGLA